MNLSGQAVSALVRFYKVPLSQFIVIHDDIDLPLGTLRIRPGGGSAGQKGMASIIEKLGTPDFARMRIGIGRPSGFRDAAGYVLEEFSAGEKIVLAQVLERVVSAYKTFVEQGLNAAMNQFNGGPEQG
jgi:peptidyl-tRNA hydrolase, PTH1 family